MSGVSKAFDHGKAFIAFLTCGDPDMETTETLVTAIAEAGADLIELGIPFSDPTAEGPVIQGANARALAAGTTTEQIFELVLRVRKTVSIPLAVMTYANVVFSYGTERFLKSAAEAGINGLILPDVPFEEREEFAPACARQGIDFIPLIAPTSQARIAKIAKEAAGFVYCVSSMGVTGVRSEITADVGEMVRLVHENTAVPAAIGFGISTPAQAKEMAQRADGVIVGSAIIKLVAQHGRNAAAPVAEYIRAMKAAVADAQ